MSDRPFGHQIGLAPEKPVDMHDLQVKLARMSEPELIAFGRQLRGLIFPKTVSGVQGNLNRSNWDIEYAEARAEWRRRHPKK